MSDFSEKVVWITGASSGIGLALARACAERGAFVVLSARSIETLEKVRLSLPEPDRHFSLPLDLEDQSNYTGLVSQVVSRYKRIDILINNGGISQRGEAGETPLDVDRKIMEINYFGTIALTKSILPVLRKQKSGHIVTISSIAGKFGFYLRSAYAASKHALQGFFESLLLEEAQNNIRVTLVYPGKINTPISTRALNADGQAHGVMDHNQETGMPAEECARRILDAVEKNKIEILVGNKEIKAVTLKRFFPKLFWKIIRNQKAT